MKRTRDLYYYFGRNEKYDYVATCMQSAVVAGRCGAGKSTFLNSLLVRVIQETNPRELDICWHDFAFGDAAIWVNSIPDRKNIPQFKEIHQYVAGDGTSIKELYSEFENSLMALKSLVYNRARECVRAHVDCYDDVYDKKSGVKDVIFIINEYQRFCDTPAKMKWFNDSISKILDHADDVGVHLLLLSQSNRDALSGETILKFPIRIVTPIDEETSNLFIGNNAAAMDSAQSGVVWVKVNKSYPNRLYVPFYPDTWLRKFVGYYSVRNEDVK
jgi:hypothetical protein